MKVDEHALEIFRRQEEAAFDHGRKACFKGVAKHAAARRRREWAGGGRSRCFAMLCLSLSRHRVMGDVCASYGPCFDTVCDDEQPRRRADPSCMYGYA